MAKIKLNGSGPTLVYDDVTQEKALLVSSTTSPIVGKVHGSGETISLHEDGTKSIVTNGAVGITDHNLLENLQGGDLEERYHMTLAEYNKLQSIGAGSINLDDAYTFSSAAIVGVPTTPTLLNLFNTIEVNYAGMGLNVDSATPTKLVIENAGIVELDLTSSANHTNATNTTITLEVLLNGVVKKTFTKVLSANNNANINIQGGVSLDFRDELTFPIDLEIRQVASQANTTHNQTFLSAKFLKSSSSFNESRYPTIDNTYAVIGKADTGKEVRRYYFNRTLAATGITTLISGVEEVVSWDLSAQRNGFATNWYPMETMNTGDVDLPTPLFHDSAAKQVQVEMTPIGVATPIKGYVTVVVV